MISPSRWLIVCGVLGILASSPAWCREWHRTDGKVLAQGKLLKVENDRAIVLSDDGLTIGIPLDQLSIDDMIFVRDSLVKSTVIKPLAKTPVAAEDNETAAAASQSVAIAADGFPLTDPNVTSWQVRADPPKWKWSELPHEPLSKQLPKFNTNERLVMSMTPSPYVAVATSREERRIWDRWDIRTGERSGAVRGIPRENGRPAISANGKFLAILPASHADDIQVWSFETGNRVGRVELEERGYSQNELAFVADDALLMRRGREVPSIFDWSTGKQRASLNGGYIFSDTRTALSPGEHYLAVFQERSARIGLLDTRNGAVAGDLLVPNQQEGFTNCGAMSFSADGSRLWALVGRFHDYRLMSWNVADSSLVVNVKLDTLASNSVGDTRNVDFIPDIQDVARAHAVLLHGSLLLDDKTATVVWQPDGEKADSEPSILRIVDDSRMLVRRRVSPTTESLAIASIPFDAIEKSREVIAKGGTSQDIELPTITQPNWADIAREQKIRKSKASYDPRPIAAPTNLPERALLSPKASTKRTTLPQIAFAGGNSAACAWLHGVPTDVENSKRNTEMMLQSASVSDAAQANAQLRLHSAVSLLDLDADGSKAVIASTEDGRIDVWNIATSKHLLGMRPAGLRDKRTPFFQFRAAGFPFAKLVGDDRLLTAHTAGELVLWRMDGAQPAYSAHILPTSSIAIDQSRTYFAAQDEVGIRICAIDDGSAVKTLSSDHYSAENVLVAASFRSDGEAVALLLLTRSSTMTRLLVWNLVEDKVACDMPIPAVVRDVAWGGDDVLLGGLFQRSQFNLPYAQGSPRTANEPNYERQSIDSADEWRVDLASAVFRVSPKQTRFLWRYFVAQPGTRRTQLEAMTNQSPSVQIVGQSSGDRAWLALSSQAGKTPLVSAGGRTAEEDETIRKKLAEKRQEIRGDDITIFVDVDSLPDTLPRADQRRGEFRTAIETSLKKQLVGNSIMIPDGGPLVVKAKLQQRRASDLLAPNGKTRLYASGTPYRPISPRGPNAPGVLARVELTSKNEEERTEPLWFKEAWFAYEETSPVTNDVRTNLQTLAPWERALNWFDIRTLPKSIVEMDNLTSIGETELTPPVSNAAAASLPQKPAAKKVSRPD